MFVQKEQLFIEADKIAWQDLGGGIRRKVMTYGDSLMGVFVDFKKGSVGALHSHPHVQFSYVQAGSFTVQIGDKSHVLGVGDFFYVPSGVIHGATAMQDGALLDVFSPMREDFLPKA